jgi:hypothetical protein
MLDVSKALATFAERARLLPWTAASLTRRIRRFCGDSWAVFAAGTDTDFGEARVMVVHDPADPDTRFESSAVLAAVREDTHLVVANSKGHNGILADDEVAGEIGRFLIGLGATPRQRTARASGCEDGRQSSSEGFLPRGLRSVLARVRTRHQAHMNHQRTFCRGEC